VLKPTVTNENNGGRFLRSALRHLQEAIAANLRRRFRRRAAALRAGAPSRMLAQTDSLARDSRDQTVCEEISAAIFASAQSCGYH
jgi:hypothetical protein